MTSDDRPLIYLVDDDPAQEGIARRLTRLGVQAQWLYPTEVDEQHLIDATLVAVDEYLEWPTSAPSPELELDETLPLICRPDDGLALTAVLRSAAKKARKGVRPLGVTLRTAKLDELGGGVPAAVRQPLLAAQHDLEWVTDKVSVEGRDQNLELVSLANALHSYPDRWTPGRVREIGINWIGTPVAPWSVLAHNHITQCRPPIETHTSTDGLAWFRWLAQRALPYPTFVLSDVRVAAMLGITPASFRAAATEDTVFARTIQAARYTGPLADLQPARYWRAAIHHLLVSTVGELDADDPVTASAALAEATTTLVPADLPDPVVCIDRDYHETGDIITREDAVRLAPEGWPAYADAAWAPAAGLEEDNLADLIAPRLR